MGIFKRTPEERANARMFGSLLAGKSTSNSTIPKIPTKIMKKALKKGTAVKRKRR